MCNFSVVGPLCAGRTVVASDNTYKTEVAPMAAHSECVKHALLSLAATYLMDYSADAQLKARANLHHRHTIRLLGRDLQKLENYDIGQGDAVVAALMLLSHNEVRSQTICKRLIQSH